VSELEQTTADSLHDPARPATRDDIAKLLEDRVPGEREGLPRGYRMRADAHYVDQLESRYVGPTVRLIATRQIEYPEPLPAGGLDTLTRSIKTHGILQPLLVRRQNARYELIAGRRRLAAATAAGVSDVPCFVYEADDAQALALAQADNLRSAAPDATSDRTDASDTIAAVLRLLATDASHISASAALVRSGAATMPLQQRVASDLVQAHAWRSAWLANATCVAAGHHRAAAARPIPSIVERVRSGFEAEARLTGLQLTCTVLPNAASCSIDEDLASGTMTGAVLVTLSWLEGVEQPRVEMRVDAPNPRTIRIEVVQRIAAVAADIGRYFADAVVPASENPVVAVGVASLKWIARHGGGSAEYTAIAGRGSIIRTTFSADGSAASATTS
jgi:ParB/RepB/Spo0J family partition protein